jgi:hypothetical protein
MINFLNTLSSPLKGWRTTLVSAAISVAGVLQTADWATLVKPNQVGPVMLGIGLVMGVLRGFTDTPIGTK